MLIVEFSQIDKDSQLKGLWYYYVYYTYISYIL
jgi:hypothetical protein